MGIGKLELRDLIQQPLGLMDNPPQLSHGAGQVVIQLPSLAQLAVGFALFRAGLCFTTHRILETLKA